VAPAFLSRSESSSSSAAASFKSDTKYEASETYNILLQVPVLFLSPWGGSPPGIFARREGCISRCLVCRSFSLVL
jgi:hypothetical protein